MVEHRVAGEPKTKYILLVWDGWVGVEGGDRKNFFLDILTKSEPRRAHIYTVPRANIACMMHYLVPVQHVVSASTCNFLM